jgi:hypothetical protein
MENSLAIKKANLQDDANQVISWTERPYEVYLYWIAGLKGQSHEIFLLCFFSSNNFS